MEEKKTFLGKIIQAILDVFKDNWVEFIKKLWKKVPSDIQDEVSTVINIVENIKNVADNQAFDLVVLATPFTWDDAALAFIRKLLTDILEKERLINVPPSQFTSGNLQSIATGLTVGLTGMSKGQASVTNEACYQNTIKLV